MKAKEIWRNSQTFGGWEGMWSLEKKNLKSIHHATYKDLKKSNNKTRNSF